MCKMKAGLVLVRPLPKKVEEKVEKKIEVVNANVADLIKKSRSFMEFIRLLCPDHKLSYQLENGGEYYSILVDGHLTDVAMFNFEFVSTEEQPVDKDCWEQYGKGVQSWISLQPEEEEDDPSGYGTMMDPSEYFDV